MIFAWFNSKRKREHLKLVWQTFTAAQRIGSTLRGLGDVEGAAVCEEFAQKTSQASERTVEGLLVPEDVKMLLDMNMGLRRTFDHLEENGPKAKVYRAMGQKLTKQNFDDEFKPALGWESLYQENGI